MSSPCSRGAYDPETIYCLSCSALLRTSCMLHASNFQAEYSIALESSEGEPKE